ncbi:glycosyltransferase family 2 protein [Brachyspira pilosicoli]|uniref:glycosyltransferase family 2 protein n=1 Tax=Brachyspira pilosicoli TaxID=52584 RepID=UPI002431AE5C|nr:glycosyltransferase family 2 protein [Brachyspira pilosicoli]WIH88997.1 glycosyltransferase [Brachyspira pilosicoli]
MISVMILVYNVEKYLRDCLNSVIGQTYKDLEIICINDGSTDNSLSILEEYAKKDSRIRIINKKNAGVSAGRNDGIENANGEYLFCVDSDDYIDRDYAQLLYENAKKNNSDFVIVSNFNSWNLDKRVTKKYHSALPTCSMFIKMSILKENKNLRYPLNVQPGEDAIFSHEVLMYAKNVSYEDKANYHYIKREGQVTQNAIKNASTLVKQIEKWFDILDEFYTKNNLWQTKSLSFAKFVEQEAFLAFRTKNFTQDDERKVFDMMKNIFKKIMINVNKDDYQYFSKEFICLIESNTIKEYYSIIKYKYNYIRFRFFKQNVSIRYKENRYKLYKNDNI